VTFYKGHQIVRNLVLPTPGKGSERQTYLGLHHRFGRTKDEIGDLQSILWHVHPELQPYNSANADRSAA